MRILDHMLPTAADNVAFDEELLAAAEEGRTEFIPFRPAEFIPQDDPNDGEILRLWEPRTPLIVVGRGSKIEDEVRIGECERLGIPIVRRASGGLAIVTGPGCLMYALVLSYDLRPELRSIPRVHEFVLDRLAAAIAKHVPGVQRAGISDLALPRDGELWKFSGNSLRCKRTHLLYHGTLLYDFDLSLIGRCLREPKRRPEYRGDRAHECFVTNLHLGRESLVPALQRAWE